MSLEWMEIVRKRFEPGATWQAETAAPALFVWNLPVSRVAPAGWRCERIRPVITSELSRRYRAAADSEVTATPFVTQGLWRSDTHPGAVVKAEVFECASPAHARETVLRLLGEFESTLVGPKSGAPGELAFGGPGDGLLIFTRGNIVCVCRNAEREVVSVMPIAESVDRAALGDRSPDDMRRLSAGAPAAQAHEREERVEIVLAEAAADRRSDGEFRRFVAPAGDISMHGARIVYRGPAAAARQIVAEEAP